MTHSGRKALLLVAIMTAGCAPRQATRPTLDANATEPDRQAAFDRYRLTVEAGDGGVRLPLMAFGQDLRFSRSDGSYRTIQVHDLMSAYPATREMTRVHWERVIPVWTLDVAAMLVVSGALDATGVLFQDIALIDGIPGVALPHPDPDRARELANAYNAALAGELGLPPPAAIPPAPPLTGPGWLRGSIGIEGALGTNIGSHADLDHWYSGTVDWRHSALGTPLFGTVVEYAVSDGLLIGMQWEPFLPRRVKVTYDSGDTDTWTLDAWGLLGRIRAFRPLGPRLGLVISLAAGRYSLSGAKLATTYWYGTRKFTGHAYGGRAQLGLERLVTRTSSISIGIGYRVASLETQDQGEVWAAPSRNGRIGVDHSGPLFETAWRFYWGVARRAAPVTATPQPAP